MKNLTENRTIRQASYIIGITIITVLSLIECKKSYGQARITAAFGVTGKPAVAGQLNISYQFKGWNLQTEVMAEGIKSGVYHGIKGGYIVKVSDDLQLQPYTGIMRKSVGNTHSQDRYLQNGHTTVLYDNLEVNSWNIPVGMQVIRQHLFIDAGAMAGKQITFFITVGITQLFY